MKNYNKKKYRLKPTVWLNFANSCEIFNFQHLLYNILFHYDFACKKVPLSLRYAKNQLTALFKLSLLNSPLILSCTTTLSTENRMSLLFLDMTTSCQMLSSSRLPTHKLVTIPDPRSILSSSLLSLSSRAM
jgi:hypothetical protein